MTLLERTLFYSSPPPEPVLRALGRVREVYGFRQISFNEKAGTLHVEYDASHLSSYDVEALLRSAGIKLAHLGPLANTMRGPG